MRRWNNEGLGLTGQALTLLPTNNRLKLGFNHLNEVISEILVRGAALVDLRLGTLKILVFGVEYQV